MKKILLGLLLTYLISCKSTKDESQETQKDQWEIQDSINKSESINLALKYNAISGWDTTEKYTYQMQEIFDTSGKLLSFTGLIIDIIKMDSNYILKVHSDYSEENGKYFAEIRVPVSKFEIYRSLFSISKEQDVCYILKNVKLYANPTLTTRIVLFQGELIDFYLYKKFETDYK